MHHTMKSYQGYSFYRYENVESKWLSVKDKDKDKDNDHRPLLPPETLCWVLQSKGKKRGRKGQPIKNTTTETESDEQRKQLFNRAWVIKEDTNGNNKNNKDKDNNNNNNNNNNDRILVRYPKGSTYHVKKENLLPVLQQDSMVVVLPETRIYRRWCVVHTQPNDSFCEIGCDVGILVDRIREHSSVPQHVSGMDKSTTSINDAKRRYPKSKFLEWSVPLEDEHQTDEDITDKNDNEAKKEEQPPPTKQETPLPMDLFPIPDSKDEMNKSLVVAIDINGNRGLKAVQQCVQIVIQEWRPRLLIVKSRALYHDLAEGNNDDDDNNNKKNDNNEKNTKTTTDSST